MKNTVNKLYGFIAKLVSLLEDELNEISSHKSKNALNIKKNITETLNIASCADHPIKQAK